MSFVQIDILLDLVTLAMLFMIWSQMNRYYQSMIALKCMNNAKAHKIAREVSQEAADRIDDGIRRKAPLTLRKHCTNGTESR